MTKTDLKTFTLEQLEAYISGLVKERFRAKQIFKWLYQMDATSFDEMTNVYQPSADGRKTIRELRG